MILKSFNSFINQDQPTTAKPVNEAKEKYKVSPAKSSNPNSQGAYTVKYVGPSFNMNVMVAYLQNDPISGPASQKVKENPDQYFFVYKTLKDNQERFLAGNSRIWVTYLDLIDAKDKNGNMTYVGFNKPPFNNFVKWNEIDRVVNKQDPKVVQAGKQVIGNVNNVATQEINKGIASAEQSVVGATSQAAQNAQGAQAGQGLSDAEKSVAANAQQFVKGGAGTVGTQSTGVQVADPKLDKLIDSLRGLSIGARGQKVDLLQNTIQKLADATKNTAASTENRSNIRANGLFDDIYREHTEKALQLLLGLDKMPEHGTIDQTVIDKLKTMLAHNPSITAQDLLTSNNQPQQRADQPVKPAVKPAAQPTQPAGPAPAPNTVAQAGKTGIEAQSTKTTGREVVAPFGTIRW